jgi:hypothetical protein
VGRNAKGQVDGAEGNTFSATNQPANRGRKARVFTQLAREWKERGIEQATPEAVKEAFQYVLALHLLDVKDISGKVEDETNDMPMVVRLAAKELLGKRSLDILKEMLDRAHGKSRQSTRTHRQRRRRNRSEDKIHFTWGY